MDNAPMKPTPGPWHSKTGDSVVFIEAPDGERVAITDRKRYYERYDETDLANAKLMASAPDMYEALRAVVEYLSDPEISFPPALHDQITTALHKAQTES